MFLLSFLIAGIQLLAFRKIALCFFTLAKYYALAILPGNCDLVGGVVVVVASDPKEDDDKNLGGREKRKVEKEYVAENARGGAAAAAANKKNYVFYYVDYKDVYAPENIVMTYDSVGRAFHYYSNAAAVPLPTLDQAAAKYVHVFHQKHLFVFEGGGDDDDDDVSSAAAPAAAVSANECMQLNRCRMRGGGGGDGITPSTLARAGKVRVQKYMNRYVRIGRFRDFAAQFLHARSSYSAAAAISDEKKNIQWSDFKQKHL